MSHYVCFDLVSLEYLARDFQNSQANDARVDLQVRILVAHALVWVGLPERARDLLSHNIVAAMAPRPRAMAHTVLGLASRGLGDFNEALGTLSIGCQVVARTNRPRRDRLGTAPSLSTPVGCGQSELPQAMIPTVRTAVRRAGSSQATAYLHIVIGALEGQRGRLTESARHCAIAQSLLDIAPNAWLQCSLLRNEGSIALAEYRLLDATSAIRSISEHAKAHSLVREIVENDANLGYVELLRGDYERSARTLSRVS